jgi:DNA-binding HxlR family transcriptional regulator
MAKRTYDHYCSLAQALDVIGDRWAPLIVRELILGPRRFTDLQRGLPGISTDMLTIRLRQLTDAGVAEKFDLERPASGQAYRLTTLGMGLEGPLTDLARWGLELMPPPDDAKAFTPSIMASALGVVLRPAGRYRMVVQLRSEGESYVIFIEDGIARPRSGAHPEPDLVIEGPPGPIMGVIVGGLEPGVPTGDQWDPVAVKIEGDPGTLDRLREMVAVPEPLRTPVPA